MPSSVPLNVEPGTGVQSCLDHVIERMQSIAQFKTRTFYVYSEKDLLDAAVQVQKPCCGVFYEGLIQGGQGGPEGISARLQVAIAVISDTNSIAGAERKNMVINILDQLRLAMLEQRAPTGHPWRFVSEVPAPNMGNNHVHVVRWLTPMMLTVKRQDKSAYFGYHS